MDDYPISQLSNRFHYHDRDSRSAFVVNEFSSTLGTTILDVGASDRGLEKAIKARQLPVARYVSVDMNDKADYSINLDKQPLPFSEGEFETVICTDVLEHLEEIHSVYESLQRIASKSIIISLPNAWFTIKKELFFGKDSTKFYGLPVTRPEDRHRWFFNFFEASDFLLSNTENGSQVQLFPYFNPSNKLVKVMMRMLLTKKRYLNLTSPTVWAVISKK